MLSLVFFFLIDRSIDRSIERQIDCFLLLFVCFSFKSIAFVPARLSKKKKNNQIKIFLRTENVSSRKFRIKKGQNNTWEFRFWAWLNLFNNVLWKLT